MALLTSGSVGFTGSTASVSVAVTAGNGNRKLIVGIVGETAVTPTALTFNGQDLVALGLEIPLTAITTDGVSSAIMFEQFDAGLPSSGSTTLSLTMSGSATGGARMYYWLVDGVRQDQLAEGGSGQIANAGSSTSTFQTDETFVAGSTDRAIFAVAYRNDNATSLLLSTPSSPTLVIDTTVTGGGRVSGSSKVGSIGTGTVRPTWTTQATGQNRRTGAACCLNPATGASLTATASFSSGAASASASALRARAVSSAGFSSSAASASASALRAQAVNAASFSASSSSVAASASVAGNRTASASFASGDASAEAAISRGREATASFSSAAASAAAELAITLGISSAGFSSGPATMSASAKRREFVGRNPSGEQRLSARRGTTTIMAQTAPTRTRPFRGRQRMTKWTP